MIAARAVRHRTAPSPLRPSAGSQAKPSLAETRGRQWDTRESRLSAGVTIRHRQSSVTTETQ